jgi:peptidyl-prolyl cis-trans isomerase C
MMNYEIVSPSAHNNKLSSDALSLSLRGGRCDRRSNPITLRLLRLQLAMTNPFAIWVKLTLIVCLAVLASFGVAFGAETTKENPDDPILARVGDEVITQKDLETALKGIPEKKRGKYRDMTLDQLIEVKVFSNEARKAELDKDPQIREAVEKATKEILAQHFIKKYVDEKSQPSEDEMKKYYSEHKEQFVIPDGVFIQHIVVLKQEDAQAILGKLKQGASFEEIAKKKSIARSYKDDGRLGWLYKGRMDPELEKVAFTLEKDKLSDVIKTKGGYEIIKVLEKSDKREIAFEEAKANIRYELFWKKKKELKDKYYAEAKVNKIPAEKGILFKIGDETFKEEIIASILSKAPDKEKEKVRQRWIDYLIEKTVFSREARKVGLEKDAEVVKELKRKTEEILANAFQKKFIDEKVQISDKEIADYYQSHQEEFRVPLRAQVKTILVKTKEEADNILKELKQGASFDTLAKEKSIHPSASQEGEISWFGKGEKDPELEKVAFSLDKDKVSDIIKTSDGYQIIKVIARMGGDVKPLDKAKTTIKMKLRVQKFQEEKKHYYEKAGVKIIKENVK